jgi:hypothetical protein
MILVGALALLIADAAPVEAGYYDMYLGTDGAYLYRLRGDGSAETRSMLLVR